MSAMKLFEAGALTIAKRGREVVLMADTDDDAYVVFDWLASIGGESDGEQVSSVKESANMEDIKTLIKQYRTAKEEAERKIRDILNDLYRKTGIAVDHVEIEWWRESHCFVQLEARI